MAVVNEWELNGMPVFSGIMVDGTPVVKVDRKSMSTAQLQSMIAIKDGIKDSKSSTFKTISVAISFLGLSMLAYAILLWAAFFLDRSNNFFEFSLVTTLTGGKVKVLDNDTPISPEMKSSGFVNYQTWIYRCIVFSLCGALLLSGIIPKGVYMFIDYFFYN